ncbi:MAG: hypothetical protein ACLTYN_05795 [Dysosmobacter welbionis]
MGAENGGAWGTSSSWQAPRGKGELTNRLKRPLPFQAENRAGRSHEGTDRAYCKTDAQQVQGLYWRQMFVTVGMVLLTLFLLGVSFFSLSYNYARGQENGSWPPRPRWWGSSPPAIWKTGGTWTWRSCSTRRTSSVWPPSLPRCPRWTS